MPSDPPLNLWQSARRGTWALFLAQGVSQIVSLVVLAGLWRLVDREAFGVIGMVFPWIVLLRMLATSGLSVAAVQRADLTEEDQSQLFWLQLAIGGIASLTGMLLGLALVLLYGSSQAAPAAAILSATIFLSSLSGQHLARLQRRMLLGRMAAIQVLSQLLAGAAAVLAAWNGWNLGALLLQPCLEFGLIVAAAWVAEPWRPRRWHRGKQTELLRFGGYYTAANLMFHIAQNQDKILLGWLLGSTPAGRVILGMYAQAFNLIMKPVVAVTTPLSAVLLPALSRGREEERPSVLIHFFRLSGLLLLPAGVGIWIVGEDVALLLGESRWETAGKFLSALAPVILVQGWINLCGSLLAAAGAVRTLFIAACLQTVLLAQGLFAGWMFGVFSGQSPFDTAIGVAWGFSLTTLVVIAIPYVIFCCRITGIPIRLLILSLLPVILAAAAMGLVVLSVRASLPDDWSAAARLAVCISTGVVSYCFFSLRVLLRGFP